MTTEEIKKISPKSKEWDEFINKRNLDEIKEYSKQLSAKIRRREDAKKWRA